MEKARVRQSSTQNGISGKESRGENIPGASCSLSLWFPEVFGFMFALISDKSMIRIFLALGTNFFLFVWSFLFVG